MSTRPRYLRRDQFVDGGVDGGVLTADAHPGDESSGVQQITQPWVWPAVQAVRAPPSR